MAGCRLSVSSGEQSLSAATAKTCLQVVAAANHRVRVAGIGISFKGTVVTDTPVKCRLVRQTTAGTMSSATVVKKDENMAETIQTTAQKTATAEPTITDELEMWEIHPQTGMRWYYPMGDEVYIKGGNRLGVELTAAQAQTAVVVMDLEE